MAQIAAGQLLWSMVADDSQLAGATERGKGMLESLGGVALKVGGLIAGAFAVKQVYDVFAGFVASASEAEVAATRLEVMLKANGYAAGFSAEALREYAGRLQDATNIEDDAIVSGLAVLAKFRNLRGDVFTGAAEAAMDLSSATGGDLASAMETVGRSLNDPIRGIRQLQREGVMLTDQQIEQVKAMIDAGDVMGAQRVIIERLNATYGGATAAMAATTEGQWNRIKNVTGDLGETIGTAILPSLKRVMDWVEQHMPRIGGWVETVAGWITNIGSEWLPWLWGVLETTTGYVVSAVATAIGIFRNLGEMWDWLMLRIGQKLSEGVDLFVWVFTEALPEYAGWFADNFVNMIVDAANATWTVLKNLGSNIKSLFAEIWDYIASGGTDKMEVAWKPLLDGFKATTEDLPDIAGPAESELTKSIREQADAIGERIADDIARIGKAGDEAVEKFFNPDAAQKDLAVPGPDLGFTAPTKDDVRDPDEKAGAGGAGSQPKASITSFEQALANFQRQALNDSEDKKQTALQTQQVVEQRRTNELMGKVVENTSQPPVLQPARAG